MIQYSTAVKNAVLATGSLKSQFDNGFLMVYDGLIPADADTAMADETLIIEYSDDDTSGGLDMAATATDGVLSKDLTQTWRGTSESGLTTEQASFFRYYKNDKTTVVCQGTVGASGAYDMVVADVSFTASTSYSIDYFSIAFLGG